MSATRPCPECGASLPPDAPRGLCPRCLMGAALKETTDHRPAGAPAATVGLDELRRAAIEAGLVDAGEFDRLADGAAGEAARAARELVRLGKLTPYQAGALVQGKGRGLVIGSYVVLDRLGRGGMGVVFKARHRRDGRVVALKILPPSFGRDPEAVARFRREFEVAAGLRHPNIVSAVDADEDRGVSFLTMDHVDGKDLDELVGAVGPLPIKLAINCAIQAATGLAAAHARGIVHRDIKPANLMLDASGTVRVLDLGLARVVEATNPLGKGAGTSLTQSGAYMGTVDYMAPEQADDSKKADQRADIYSLGCTLHFLLTGRPPFDGDTALKRLMAHQNQPAPSLHASRDDILAPLEAAYQTMMAKRPGDRPRSMTEVIELLEGCRSTSEEARDARAGLKRAFAETVLKRAVPRGRDRPRDASIFARPKPDEGLVFDPDLRFEDVVMDLRPEHHSKPLAEEDLPPALPRLAPPRKRSRRRAPTGLVWALAIVVLALAALALRPGRSTAPPATVPPPVAIKPAPAEPSWRPLFNGKDLSGWTVAGNTDRGWKVVDGALVLPRGSSWSRLDSTRNDLGNFRLRFEAKLSDGGDCTVSVRAGGATNGSNFYSAVIAGAESTDSRTGDLLAQYGTPASRVVAARATPVPIAPGEWFPMEVVADGGTIISIVKGQEVARFDDTARALPPGAIGIYARPDATLAIRKVEIQERPASPSRPATSAVASASAFVPLFNGKDLSGWRPDKGDPGLWGVEGGALVVRGRGPREQAYLLSDRSFSDFHLRFEVQLPKDADSGVGLWALPGEAEMPVEVNLRTFDDRPSQMAAVRTVRKARFEDYAPTDRPVSLLPEGGWNAMEVEARGGRLRIRVNGEDVVDRDLRPLVGDPDATLALKRHSGRIGLQALAGTVRFRKIEVRDLAPGATAAAPESAPKGTTTGRLIYSEGYDGPRDDWQPPSREDLARDPGHTWGIREGVFFNQITYAGWYGSYLPGGPFPDATFEVVGRVTGDKPTSRGSFLAYGLRGERGWQVRIDGMGLLFVEPNAITKAKHPEGPWIGPISHPAIVPGGAGFNRVRLDLRGRRLEIFVNGARVCDPVEFDQELTPATLGLGVECAAPTVRAEYDRVEVRALLPEAPAAPATSGVPKPDDARFQPGSVWTLEEPVGTPVSGTFTVTARDARTFKALFDLPGHVREVTGTIVGAEIRWSARDVKVIRGNAGRDNRGTIRGDVITAAWGVAGQEDLGTYLLRLKKGP